MTADQSLDIKALNTKIKGTSSVDISSDGVLKLKGSTTRIGQGLYPLLRLSPDMATFLSALSALIAGSGVTSCQNLERADMVRP